MAPLRSTGLLSVASAVFFSQLPSLANAQSMTPKADYFFQRRWAELAVVGDYVYIEGGDIEQYTERSRDRNTSPSNVTLSLSLRDSWTNSTVEFKTFDKGKKEGSVYEHNLWVDAKGENIYLWDGSDLVANQSGAADPKIWILKPDGTGGGSWGTVEAKNANVFNGIRRAAAASGTTCGNMAYDLGGFVRDSTDDRVEGGISIPAPGMVSFNMETREWQNQSLVEMSPPSGIYMRGAATCVTGFDDKGYVMTTGGYASGRVDAFKEIKQLSFSNITFYNQDSQTWSWQQTTSEDGAPIGRSEHCSVGIQSSRGTYEIYVYGGNSDDSGALDDIWVLSLPGFRWFRIDASSTKRFGHECAIVGKSQILSLGGNTGDGVVDPLNQGLGIFDLSKMAWSDKYDAEAADYEPPKVVREWYQSGGLDKVNWSNDEVKKMFTSKEAPFSNSTDGNGADGSNSGGNSDSGSSKTNVGAIAGGAVGGVAAIALLVGGLFFWRRRKRAAASAQQSAYQQPPYTQDPQQSQYPQQPQYYDPSPDPNKQQGLYAHKPELDSQVVRPHSELDSQTVQAPVELPGHDHTRA